MDSILTPELTRAALEIAGMILALILSAAAAAFRQKTGIEIDLTNEVKIDLLRQRLDEVIRRAVQYAVTQVEDVIHTRADAAFDYVVRGAGDTLDALGIGEKPEDYGVLRKRLEMEISKAEVSAQNQPSSDHQTR
jgi:signal transduction histidine kinase